MNDQAPGEDDAAPPPEPAAPVVERPDPIDPARAPVRDPIPTATAATGANVLRLVDGVALATLAAIVLGRAIAPELRGLVVGTDQVVVWVERAGAFFAQLVAMVSEVVAMSAALAFMATRMPRPLRVAAVAVTGIVVLLTLSSSVRPLPESSALLVGAGASVIALGGALGALRSPVAAAAARVVVAVAFASMLRLVALSFAIEGARLATAARVLATLSLAGQALALLLAMAAAARPRSTASGGAPPPRSLVDPALVVVLGAALLGVRGALVDTSDAGPGSVFLRRAVEVLTPRPAAFGPFALAAFIALLALLFAALSLARRGTRPPGVAGAVALALIASSAPEIPVASIALVIAGFSLALIAHDPTTLWRALASPRGASTG